MFNRKALVRRVEELEQQSQITRQPVGVIARRHRPLQADQRLTGTCRRGCRAH
jgi:hypothetical protein